ncbi:MAG: hypothetical protein MHMPM18_002246, partial [Marteilia pararefringens]
SRLASGEIERNVCISSKCSVSWASANKLTRHSPLNSCRSAHNSRMGRGWRDVAHFGGTSHPCYLAAARRWPEMLSSDT